MIIIGHKSIPLVKEIINAPCPNCGTSYNTEITVFQKYVHVFWIPYLPAGKTGVSECHHCHQMLKHREMTSSLLLAYKDLKAKAKIPLWMFSGLVLMLLLIVYGVNENKKKKAINAQLISSPKGGDLLEVKTDSSQYTLYKVYQVHGDSVLLRANNYQSDTESGIRELRDSAYSEEIRFLSKTDLKKLFEKGTVIGVERE